MDDTRSAEIKAWLARQGLSTAHKDVGEEIIKRFEEAQAKAVALEDYTWGAELKASDRLRLLAETRAALDADPGLVSSSEDVPDTISDSDLYLKWLRS